MSTKKSQESKKRRRLDRGVWVMTTSPEPYPTSGEIDPLHPDAIIGRDAPSSRGPSDSVPLSHHAAGTEGVLKRKGTPSPSLKSAPEIPESPQASRPRTRAERNAASAKAGRLASPIRIVTPGRRAYSEELPSQLSLHTPLDTRGNLENLSHSGIQRQLLSGRKNSMLTPHGRAAHRTLDLRRAAIFTPSQNRRRSVQEQRETPHGWLSELSRALAPKSKPIDLSPDENDADDVDLVDPPGRHTYDDNDDDLPIRPRLSMNIDLDDPDLRPHTSHGLEDQNYTAHSIELPRRAISEQPPGDITELEYRISEFPDDRSDDMSVDLGFFPQRPLEELDAASHVHDETLIRESPQRHVLSRVSDFGLQVPLDLDQSTFVMDVGADDAGGDEDLAGQVVERDEAGGVELAPSETSFPRTPSPNLEEQSQRLSINGRQVLRSAEVTPEQANIGKRRTQKLEWEEDIVEADEVLDVPSSPPDQPRSRQKRNVKGSKRGNQFDALPENHVKKVSQGILRSLNFKTTITKPTMKALMRATNWFFKQMSEDLGAYARHAGRNTITEADVVLLMKRQGHINETTTLFSLAQKYLPREMVQLLRVPPDPMLKDPPKRRAVNYEDDEEEHERQPPPPRPHRQTTLKNPSKRMAFEDGEDDDDDNEGGEEVQERLPPRRRRSTSRKPPKRKVVDVDEDGEEEEQEYLGPHHQRTLKSPPEVFPSNDDIPIPLIPSRQSKLKSLPKMAFDHDDDKEGEEEDYSAPHRRGKPKSKNSLKRKRGLNDDGGDGADDIPIPSIPVGGRSQSRRARQSSSR